MKTLLPLLILLISFSTFSLGNPRDVYGEAQYFYDLTRASVFGGINYESDEITEFVKQVHESNGLPINVRNTSLRSTVTEYSHLSFSRNGENYFLKIPAPGEGEVVIPISQNLIMIARFFADIQSRAHFIQIDGAARYGRGGTHLEARNLPEINDLTLICRREIYSDDSGGNHCKLLAKQINFNNANTTVFVSGSNSQEVIVPTINLKTWSQDY